MNSFECTHRTEVLLAIALAVDIRGLNAVSNGEDGKEMLLVCCAAGGDNDD